MIDCGHPGFVPKLEEEAKRFGISLESLTKVIITHHDMDHLGSLVALKRQYPAIQILAPEQEKLFIEGTIKSLRLEQAEESLHAIPDEMKPGAEAFIRYLKSIELVKVDRTLSYGERLPWYGGIQVVHTPGHMPSHISLYLPEDKTMIAADAVVIEDGELNIANPQFALDLDEAVRSCERLLAYDNERLICYHGGEYQGDIRQALKKLIDQYT